MMSEGDDFLPSHRPIAVIDDDLGVRAALCNLLDSAGYRSCSFDCGEDFLVSPCLEQACCAIVDLGLARMSGFELAEQLAQLRPTLPLLLISAQVTPAQRQRALALGFPLLTKPVDADTLLVLLTATLLYGRT
ncbi:transcriptional regulator [Herbaspirillum rubrisubalbicans]|uniref:Transcriptional regulator n=1 Tax=Herbaspirillum rubrisubalbicans TaxID=80842 RepID=A0ABX9C0W2_9BURK|nr:response regulator [Herbaspirillum rubrisubalbicans]RAM63738.1 transcriptional regulator [Herbaspirillum rubrisubalbicans]RAN44799.1 transcriptional regulator [Herbaspirillum rubrisubalbicans]